MRDEDGTIISTLSLGQDITERSKAEALVQQQRDEAEQYFNIAGSMLVVLNQKGEVVRINNKGVEMLGYSKDHIIGKNWFDFFVPVRNRSEVAAVFAQLMRKEISLVEYYENPILTKSGEERLIAWHNAVLYDDEGTIAATLSSGEDVTQQRRHERDLKVSAEEWSRTFDAITDYVFLLDTDCTIKRTNKAFFSTFNLQLEDVIGKKCYEVVHDSKGQWPDCPFQQTVQNKECANVEFYEPRLGIHLFVTTAPILDSDSQIAGVVHVERDITERKKTEEELQKRVSEMERFHKLSVDRELKMRELKQKIDELEKGRT